MFNLGASNTEEGEGPDWKRATRPSLRVRQGTERTPLKPPP